MLGRVRMYNLGFVVFTVGSALCGLSPDAAFLIASRLVQGAGAAMMLVNSVAILTEAFPPNERGQALGINAVTFAVGGVLGPILGGLLLTAGDWRWIFFINVPIGVAGTWWGYRVLRELSTRAPRQRFDLPGATAFSGALTAALLALTLGIQDRWTAPPILGLFAAAVALIAFWFWWEHRTAQPVLDLRLFQSRVYNFSVLSAMMQMLAYYSLTFLVLFFLQAVRGETPLQAAFLLIPAPLVSALVAPASGRLSDRIGARLPATLGLLVQASGLAWFARLTATAPYPLIAAGLAWMGLGGGMFFSPNTSAAMNASPRDRLGIASGTLATLRQVGMVTSFAISMATAGPGCRRA